MLDDDERDRNLLPGAVRCWTRIGKQRKIPTPGTNQKWYGFGAVNFVTVELTTQIGEHKDSNGYYAMVNAFFSDPTAHLQTVLSIIGNTRRPSKRKPQLLCSPIFRSDGVEDATATPFPRPIAT